MIIREIDAQQVRLLLREYSMQRVLLTADGFLIDANTVKCDVLGTFEPNYDAKNCYKCHGCSHAIWATAKTAICGFCAHKQICRAYVCGDAAAPAYVRKSVFITFDAKASSKSYCAAWDAIHKLQRSGKPLQYIS